VNYKIIFNFRKAQGALEYLLLIGGAVLIAVIVIFLLVGIGDQNRDAAQIKQLKYNNYLGSRN
jgi:uncharacterized protein (UPF0333 family)